VGPSGGRGRRRRWQEPQLFNKYHRSSEYTAVWLDCSGFVATCVNKGTGPIMPTVILASMQKGRMVAERFLNCLSGTEVRGTHHLVLLWHPRAVVRPPPFATKSEIVPFPRPAALGFYTWDPCARRPTSVFCSSAGPPTGNCHRR
jgi:hypothetical protein